VEDEHGFMSTVRERWAVMDRGELDFELRDVDERLLDELEQGWRTRQWLAIEVGVTGDYVYQRIDLLIKLGVVERIHDGFYRLADDDRDAPADPIEAVASTINIGRTDTERDANREVVRVATRWLRDRDETVRKGDAPLAEWQSVDTHPQAPRSEKTLWNDVIVVAWRRSDLVADTSRTFAWVGAES
jgi:hypothetical protein